MKRLTPLLLLLLALPAWAAVPKAVIVCPASVPVGTPILLDASQSEGDTAPKWKLKKGPSSTLNVYNQNSPDGKTERHNVLAIVPKAEAGTYSSVLIVGGKDAAGNLDYDFDFADVVVGPAPVPPTPPVPPGPTPPIPPGPTPPTPQPSGSIRVLILYESQDLSKIPASQNLVLYSKTVRDYLQAKSPVGADGKTHQWGIYDVNEDLSFDPWMKDAAARPHASVPWIVIGDGVTPAILFEGPLPGNIDDTLALLKKFGGA